MVQLTMFRNRKTIEKIMAIIMVLVVLSMVIALFGPGIVSK